jgi:hypothetical protein
MTRSSTAAQPLRLFYSYSHKDEKMREQLEAHLSLLQREGLISPWHFRKIGAGEEWEGAINRNLATADIVLLLVSASFLASNYCYDVEMKRALSRHKARRARVIPIILRDVDWKTAPFSALQALPTGGKPITAWRPQDKGWTDVAKGIRDAAKALRTPPPPAASGTASPAPAKVTPPKPRAGPQQRRASPGRPADVQTMLARADKLFPQRIHDYTTRLCVIVAGGVDQVIRPAALTQALGEQIREHTRVGRARLLDPADSTKVRLEGGAVIIEQTDVSILADEQGSVRIITTAPQRHEVHGLAMGIVEEDVRDRLVLMLRASDRVLKDVDPKGAMSEVVIVGGLLFSSGINWKNAADYARSAQTWTGSMKSGPIRVQLTPPQRSRSAISREAGKIADDFVALLRRQIVG